MMAGQLAGRVRGVGAWVSVVTLLSLSTGCSRGPIDAADVADGSVNYGQPYTLRDGGKAISGTVVHKNAAGKVVDETSFKDGFPNGTLREWYDSGQMKSEREVEYKDKSLHPRGTARVWCENGTLQQESEFDGSGNPVGKQQTWTCSGKLLSLTTRPFGPVMSAVEMQGGDVVLIEEGVHPQGGGWDGEHKRFNNQSKPQLLETWANGKRNGPYQAWDTNGDLAESGTYADGKKVGAWTTSTDGLEVVYDHDAGNFVDPKYVGAFMQAAGIQPANGWAAKSPLREFKVDPEKIKYYVSEGLVDPKKKLSVSGAPTGDENGISDWTYAYVRASHAALDQLVELGADPKAVDSDKRSRLYYCIFSLYDPNLCSPQEIQRLLALGISAQQADIVGSTPLHELILATTIYGRAPTPQVESDVLKLLLAAGADVDAMNRANQINPQAMSPLMIATLQKQFGMATTMLDQSKNPAQTTKDGMNLVHLVFLTPDMRQFSFKLTPEAEAFVKLAVGKGVDPNAKVGEMGSLKDIAQQSGAIDMAQFFSSLSAAG